MKNLKKYILINISIFLILFILLEYIVYYNEIRYRPEWKSRINRFSFLYPYHTNTKLNWNIIYKKILNNEIKEIESGFRKSEITSDLKNSVIILFGCSFTYGAWLKDNETFSYKLQNFTKNLVINRAFSGWGPSSMLYQLRLSDFLESLNKTLYLKSETTVNPYYVNGGGRKSLSVRNTDVKYVIFTFISDHINRNYLKCDYFDDKFIFYKFKKNDNFLIEKNNFDNIYWHSYTARRIYISKMSKYIYSYNDDVKKMTLLHFTESYKKIKKLFPKAIFVIFVYDGDNYIKLIQKELEDNGIKIVYLSELSNIDFSQDKYKVDEQHPNEEAWNIIVPLLAKKLNL